MGSLLLITGAVLMTVATVVERLQWHRGLVSPVGIRRAFVIGAVLMGLGAIMMGIAPVPGGF
jgi:Ni/Fe-hydrogenase subunit HybB-like protein